MITLLLATTLKMAVPSPLTCAELRRPEISVLAGKDKSITLRMEKTSLDRVFKAMGEQAGFKSVFRGYTPVVSVKLEGIPLEQALADLARGYGLSIRASSADRMEVRGPLAVAVGGVTKPMLKTKKDPEFERLQRVFGKVVLQVVICEDGKVGAVSVAPGTEEPRLIDAAIDAVQEWIYEPALKDGKPVAVSFTTSVEFLPE